MICTEEAQLFIFTCSNSIMSSLSGNITHLVSYLLSKLHYIDKIVLSACHCT